MNNHDTTHEIYADRAELDQAVRSQDAAELAETLALLPIDWEAFRIALTDHADTVDASEPNDPARLRLAVTATLIASAVPGQTVCELFASEIDQAMTLWYSLKSETPEQRATRKAFAEARRLMDLHGDEDPRAMLAAIHAVNLADPGYIDNALVECGIHLPTAKHHDKDGAPLFSLDAIAEALDADPDDLMGLVDQMEDAGLCVRPVVAGRIQ